MFALFLHIMLIISNNPQIDRIVDNYLAKQLNDCEKYEYQIINAPEGFSTIAIDETREFKLAGNTGYIPVIITRNNSRGSASYVSVRISVYQYVLVALKDVKKGESLKIEDFDLRLEDISKVKGTIVNNPGNIESFRSKFTIRENTVLVREIVEGVPVLNVGDKVNANVVSGSVVISTDAFARQEGGIGDIIIVRTTDNKQFKAEVIDKNNVLIVE